MAIDPGLWTELEAWAQDELRSVNGQIEYILKQAVLRRQGATSRPAEDGSATTNFAGPSAG